MGCAAKRRNGACATGHFKTSQSEVGYSDQLSGFRPAVKPLIKTSKERALRLRSRSLRSRFL